MTVSEHYIHLQLQMPALYKYTATNASTIQVYNTCQHYTSIQQQMQMFLALLTQTGFEPLIFGSRI